MVVATRCIQSAASAGITVDTYTWVTAEQHTLLDIQPVCVHAVKRESRGNIMEEQSVQPLLVLSTVHLHPCCHSCGLVPRLASAHLKEISQ